MNPPGAMIDRLSRFVRVRGNACRIAAMAVAAVIVLELVGLAAWWSYSRWRLGYITGSPALLMIQERRYYVGK